MPHPPAQPASMLLARTFRAMTDRFHDRLAEHRLEPLRPAHGFVFRYLAANEHPTTVDLAAHLGVSKQAAGKTVAELVEWAYVRREPHPTDRRAQALALTTKGHDYLRLADRLWAELDAEFAALVGDAEFAALRDSLTTYLDHTSTAGIRPVW
ncbi:MarR family winged helix-turn-helix transcriptional regulator [Actinosynnema sp. NPDC047251]|uniref:MarR family winged helix-turn-helix transcriptional regulator n=1 Tax=Saccharothrix espanaensis TaxID=103731 RepID=UPI0018D3596A|nr:MarR family winged helix-turn-helix transcriptional regulator [Saccharothrix espanaensis]